MSSSLSDWYRAIRLRKRNTPAKPRPASLNSSSASSVWKGGFYSGIPKALRDYLVKRITPDAAGNHISGGLEATIAFEQLIATRLVRANGTQRRLGVIPTGEIVDRYARMLAYIVPWFANTPADPLPLRATQNATHSI